MAVYRFRGAPYYLDQQGDRLGVPKILTDRARHNPEIHRVGVLAGQLCERWHRAPRCDGVPAFGLPELAQVRGTIGQIEQEVAKLHVLAAAAQAIADEARAVYGFEAADHDYHVACAYDSIPTD